MTTVQSWLVMIDEIGWLTMIDLFDARWCDSLQFLFKMKVVTMDQCWTFSEWTCGIKSTSFALNCTNKRSKLDSSYRKSFSKLKQLFGTVLSTTTIEYDIYHQNVVKFKCAIYLECMWHDNTSQSNGQWTIDQRSTKWLLKLKKQSNNQCKINKHIVNWCYSAYALKYAPSLEGCPATSGTAPSGITPSAAFCWDFVDSSRFK